MRLLVVRRGADAKPQIVGEFTWKDGGIVTKEDVVEGARAVMEGLRSELDSSSEGKARSSMKRLAQRYAGGYLWVRYEADGRGEVKEMWEVLAELSDDALLRLQDALSP